MEVFHHLSPPQIRAATRLLKTTITQWEAMCFKEKDVHYIRLMSHYPEVSLKYLTDRRPEDSLKDLTDDDLVELFRNCSFTDYQIGVMEVVRALLPDDQDPELRSLVSPVFEKFMVFKAAVESELKTRPVFTEAEAKLKAASGQKRSRELKDGNGSRIPITRSASRAAMRE